MRLPSEAVCSLEIKNKTKTKIKIKIKQTKTKKKNPLHIGFEYAKATAHHVTVSLLPSL